MSSNPAAARFALDDLAGCGLCCPEDPLHEVMGCFLPVLDDGFMDTLGVSRPYPATRRHGEPTPSRGGGAQEPPPEDFDVDMFFADDAPDDGGAATNYMPCHAADASAPLPAAARVLADTRGVGPTYPAPPPTLPAHDALDCDDIATVSAPSLQARDVFDHISEPPAHDALAAALVPYFAPPSPERDVFDGVFPVSASPPPPPLLLPAHDDALAGALLPYYAAPLPAHGDAAPAVLPLATASWSSTSSGSGCASSMTTWGETDSPPRALSSPLRATWLVPRRRRTRPITRRNYGWLPKHQLHAAARPPLPLPPPPPPPPRATATSVKVTSNIKRPVEKVRQRNRQRQRVCSHCSNTETPQWRAGPLGPGTLCNACGIRYKQNGKLFEEYRPSTSPSFDSGKHSNRQRKVVKLAERKQALLKRTTMPADDSVPSPGPPPCAGGGEFMDVCTYISTG